MSKKTTKLSKKPLKKNAKRSKKAAPKQNFIRRLASTHTTLIIGACVMLFGLGILGFQMLNLWRSQQTAAAPKPISDILKSDSKQNERARISGIPTRIKVPSVNIDLEVIPGYHYEKSNTWTLTLDKAQWGVMSRPANDSAGMTFIYGQYRKGVFSSLPKIQPGEIAQVTTKKGDTLTYKFKASSIVPPSDDSIFSYQGKPVLILQTCTGIRFESRQLFVFNLVKVG